MRSSLLAGAMLIGWTATAVAAEPNVDGARMQRGEATLRELHKSTDIPPHTAQLKREFPDLAALTFSYALGDVWGRDVLKPRERQLIALSALAAQGTLDQFKVHAAYALDAGVPPADLLEVIYIVTVTSGFPRALGATGALKEVFAERSIRLPLEPAKPK